jgi:carboxypeptidase C (cathepsin A)
MPTPIKREVMRRLKRSKRMNKKMGLQAIVVLVLVAVGLAQRIQAQEVTPASKPQEVKPSPAADFASGKEEFSVTEHVIRIKGQVIPYRATAGTTLLRDDKGEPTGLMYAVAYTRSDVKDPSLRPVAFFYNGGPGSASLWLHMGAFGPRRVVTVDGAFTPPAPYALADNTESLIDKTDMVFIDAMGTGYSRAVGKAQNKDFYGIDEDVQAFAQFIRTYLNRNGRWNSPKFLVGESYGTFRSAALGNTLQSRDGIHLNGIVLVSTVLDMATITFGAGDDRPYVFYLPSYAAVAWYHRALKNRPPDLDAFLVEVRRYAQGDYAAALFKGAGLPASDKQAVAVKLAEFTGLSLDYWLKANLRVTLAQFNVELERGRGLTTGRIDARFTGFTRNLLAENAQGDPEGPAVGGAFTTMLNTYNHQELKFGQDKTYNTSSGGAREWNWRRQPTTGGFPGAPSTTSGGFFPGAPNVEADLAQAMITNPRLLVQVENGIYDMATPFFATEFTMTHLGLPSELQAHIKLNYYPAGHMMYLQEESRVKLHDNVAAFIDRATQR